jgi:hypothetical protein
MPPEWMWTLDHELEVWFERLDSERDERYGGGKTDIEGPVMENELARERRK